MAERTHSRRAIRRLMFRAPVLPLDGLDLFTLMDTVCRIEVHEQRGSLPLLLHAGSNRIMALLRLELTTQQGVLPSRGEVC